MQIGFVGIGAGAAAALLFATVTSGSYLSILLFYLAPLPIMIAGLGWSHWSALIGAAAGSILLAALFGGVFPLGFLAAVGAPGWWLSRLAMTARPAPGGESSNSLEISLDWFPPGMLVVWAALIGAALVLISIPMIGLDAASFHAGMVRNLSRVLQVETGTPAGKPLNFPGVDNVARMLDVLAMVVPPAAAIVATVVSLIDLWLAGRVVRFSSRLARPWPRLSEMAFPLWVAFLLAAAIGVSFAGGIAAIAASVVAASLTVAYGVLGFAVLHEITRGLDSRPLLLGGVYASVLVFGWPILVLSVLGLAETAVGLRGRVAAKRAGTTKR